ncbi:helix-turn-helix domain-containing protein [Limosilactobacillus fermentum]|uniref:Helix-turn-helix domain-containing protein n=1 Tax=Limosilactobacillus fermentum TaxID=1613 RepID=A0A843R1A3_LIMFE|nr:helix-turn-helix transcriptional regulator [Limosilactobacillus fermentum]MPQ35798.1 helix-turn-helix domain-containing protein [Limosilactobacillus fermentum]
MTRRISYDPLWKIIKEKNISKKDLWKQAHISASTCQKLRQNENVTTDTLKKICNVLNCNIEEVIELIEEG